MFQGIWIFKLPQGWVALIVEGRNQGKEHYEGTELAMKGFRVVRVIAPELCQLDVVEQARYLGGSRLYEAAYEAGLVSRPLTVAELNPDPHPFP